MISMHVAVLLTHASSTGSASLPCCAAVRKPFTHTACVRIARTRNPHKTTQIVKLTLPVT
jgi:hypothetical protein